MKPLLYLTLLFNLISCSDQKKIDYCDEAKRFYKNGNYKKAIELYSESIKNDSIDHVAYDGIGQCYFKQNLTVDAIKYYTRAIHFNNKYKPAYHNRGLCYRRLENYQLALPDFDMAVKLDGKSYNSHLNRGICFRYLGQYQRAKEDFDAAIAIDPNNGDAYLSRVIAVMAQPGNNNKEEIDNWIKVLELKDSIPEDLKKMIIKRVEEYI